MLKSALVALLLMAVAPMVSAKTENLTLRGARGKLAAVMVTPELQKGEKCPMVIICHGFMGNKNEAFLKNISDKLCEKGIASIRFDFNGHGESEGDFQQMTVLNEIEDAHAVYNYVKSLSTVSDIGICGHSQGGVVASMTAGQLHDGIDAVALLAPAAVLREDAIRGTLMGQTYNPLDPPEYVEIFGGKKAGHDYLYTSARLPIYTTARQFQGPACMVHGTGDTIVPYTYSLRYHEIWPNSEVHLLDGLDHIFSTDQMTPATIVASFFANALTHTTISNL